jgi:glycosyltransferase involved in cell wall biosynthesis
MEIKTQTEANFSATVEPKLLSVSIVMPSYNRRDRLEKVTRHIAQQKYPQDLVELVVCLDGCTDGSAEVLHKIQPDYPFKLVILEQTQSGPAAARNRALKAAQGELILFLDDDVFPIPELIDLHVQHHLQNPNLVVIGPMEPPADFERPFWVRWEEDMLDKQYRDMIAGAWEVTWRQFYTGNCSVRREKIEQVGGFNESFKRAEDVEMALRLEDIGMQFAFEPKAIGYHYATRTYQSWENARYQYGKYDVIMSRQAGRGWLLEMMLGEFKNDRNRLTRFLCKITENRPPVYKVVKQGLFWVSSGLHKVKQKKWSHKALSTLANIVYWQGLQDEMKKSRLS